MSEKENNMICKRCGNVVPKGIRFCNKCGATVGGVTPVTSPMKHIGNSIMMNLPIKVIIAVITT